MTETELILKRVRELRNMKYGMAVVYRGIIVISQELDKWDARILSPEVWLDHSLRTAEFLVSLGVDAEEIEVYSYWF